MAAVMSLWYRTVVFVVQNCCLCGTELLSLWYRTVESLWVREPVWESVLAIRSVGVNVHLVVDMFLSLDLIFACLMVACTSVQDIGDKSVGISALMRKWASHGGVFGRTNERQYPRIRMNWANEFTTELINQSNNWLPKHYEYDQFRNVRATVGWLPGNSISQSTRKTQIIAHERNDEQTNLLAITVTGTSWQSLAPPDNPDPSFIYVRFGFKPQNVLHVGDQFLKHGNDFICRFVATNLLSPGWGAHAGITRVWCVVCGVTHVSHSWPLSHKQESVSYRVDNGPRGDQIYLTRSA